MKRILSIVATALLVINMCKAGGDWTMTITITITGINDVEVAQVETNGGKVVWNGCGSDGERVDTGVYYICAITNTVGENRIKIGRI